MRLDVALMDHRGAKFAFDDKIGSREAFTYVTSRQPQVIGTDVKVVRPIYLIPKLGKNDGCNRMPVVKHLVSSQYVHRDVAGIYSSLAKVLSLVGDFR